MQTSETRKQRFVELVEAHQGVLHRICSLYVPRAEEQRDLFQEMVLQLWRSYHSFRGDSCFATWMYKVALNTALMARRSEARRPHIHSCSKTELNNIAGAARFPSEDVVLLRESIQQLPSLDRAIVLLHLEGHSYDEISKITGLTRSNVSVRLVRLKQRLRRALEERGLERETLQ